VQFKFPKLDYSSPQAFTDSLDDHRECFGPSDLDLSIHVEGRRSRITRPDGAVTPVGEQDGDEILDN
jgi:hypothetical protein